MKTQLATASLVIVLAPFVTESAAAGNTCLTAETLFPSAGTRFGHLSFAGDADYYRIWVPAGRTLTVAVAGTPLTANIHLHYYGRDSTCVLQDPPTFAGQAVVDDAEEDAFYYWSVHSHVQGGDYEMAWSTHSDVAQE